METAKGVTPVSVAVTVTRHDRVYPVNVAGNDRFNATVPCRRMYPTRCNGLRSCGSGGLTFCEGTIIDLVLQFPGFVLLGVGMRWIWNPSIKPTRDDNKTRDDHKVYLVVDGFGHNGRIFRERDVETLSLI
jgi:hypothetical protein